VLALAALVAVAASGCGAACDTSDDGNVPERYTGGTSQNGVYESSLLKSGLLPFPGGKQYQLVHRLGFTPATVQVLLSFGPNGDELSPCAGNSCLVRCMDDEMIWIKNDTCAEFWVRVATSGRSNESRYRICTEKNVDASPTNDAPVQPEPETGMLDASGSDVGDAFSASPDASDAGADAE
jgi:hypothetical protein